MQGKGTVYPAVVPFRRKFDERCGNVHARPPLVFLGENLPADFEHVGMNTQPGPDQFQFLVRLKMITEFQPAFGSFQMDAVRRFKRFDALSHS